jgi:PHD/YefM family antitoxin component YafN of YafNO toxin-antitoxin module
MSRKSQPELVYRDGKPVAVILSISAYEQMLEQLEDKADLEALRRMRERPLHFRSLDAYLEERAQRV